MGMDRLSAHLDRGWDLLDQGDVRGAKASAKRALALSKSSPEATNLLGKATLLEGDLDGALELFRSAIALDDGYVDAFINAAEVHLARGELDEALSLADEVLEFSDHPDDVADAVLLQVDVMLDRGDVDGARRAMDRLPEEPLESPHFAFLLGRAWVDLGDPDRAEPLLVESLKADPSNPDAHYYLALAFEQRREWRRATLSMLESAALEARAPRAPWSLPREQFHKRVERAMAAVDPSLAAHVEGALVLIADAPGVEVIADGVDPRAAVLIEGMVTPETPARDPGEARDDSARVFVYQRGVERRCPGVEDLEEVITLSIEDEVRAHLGLPAPGEAAHGRPVTREPRASDPPRPPAPRDESPDDDEAPKRRPRR